MKSRYKTLYQQGEFPVFQNEMYKTKQDAIDCQKANIRLIQNLDSGLIYNLDFNPELMKYSESYQNEQAVSPYFKKHLDSVAEVIKRLLGRHSLLEVGCGKVYFLEFLQSQGVEITGFDPTYEGQNISIKKCYFEKGAGACAEGVILRHVLEHIQDPVNFLQELNLENNKIGRVYIEVPCLDWIIENKAWFDIFYEHVNYFRLSDLNRMFSKVIESGRLFGGQYIYIVAELSSIQHPTFDGVPIAEIGFSVSKDIQSDPLVIWGAASKGVIYSLLKIRDGSAVDMVIDINPAKQGKYLPATGLLVSSPVDAMKTLEKWASIFVMNDNYMDEIKDMTKHKFTYIKVK